jgi:5-methylthioribose kinase
MIEQQMGAPLPKPDEQLPEEYEIQISRLVAQASQQVLQANQAQAAQQQAQQQMQDPIIQMQMQELQIKGQEVQRKTQKDAMDAQLKREQMAIEDKRIDVQAEIEGTKIGAKIEKDKEEFAYKQELEGTKLGYDMAKSKEKSMIELARIAKERNKSKGE